MIVPVMAISNLVLTQQIYSEETNGAHAHCREPVPLNEKTKWLQYITKNYLFRSVFTIYSAQMNFCNAKKIAFFVRFLLVSHKPQVRFYRM